MGSEDKAQVSKRAAAPKAKAVAPGQQRPSELHGNCMLTGPCSSICLSFFPPAE